MKIATKVKLGYFMVVLCTFILGYVGFLGVERARYSFVTVSNLTYVMHSISKIVYLEDLFLITGDISYKFEVDKELSSLLSYSERLEGSLSEKYALEYYVALLPKVMKVNLGYIREYVSKLAYSLTSLNQNLEYMERRNLRKRLHHLNSKLFSLLAEKGVVKEASELLFYEKQAFYSFDPRFLTRMEDVLLRLSDTVKEKHISSLLKEELALLRECKELMVKAYRDLDSYRKVSRTLMGDIWDRVRKQKKATRQALLFTMGATTVIFLLVLSFSIFAGTKFTWVVSYYFGKMLELMEDIRKGDFSRRIEVKGDSRDEFSILAEEFNKIMALLEENVGYIITSSKKALESRLTKISDAMGQGENPVVVARNIVGALVETNRYKGLIESDYTRAEVYKHLKYVLSERFGVDNVLILEVNESKNRFEPVFEEDIQRVPIDLVVNPALCRAKRTMEIVDSSEFRDICPFACQTEGCFSFCIPMIMGGEVKGVVRIDETLEGRERLLSQMPFIVKYVEITSPVVYASKLLEITKEQSLKDGLTGLYNRRFLESYLEKYISFARRKGFTVGFIMIDIDNFKRVNDTYGHKNGDIVLKEVSRVIVNSIRSSDVAVRYGGEEFLVILPEVEEGKTELVAEKIRRTIEMTNIQLEGKTLHVTVSAGVAEYPKHGEDPHQVIKFADVALYRAKKMGKNRVVVFDEATMVEGVDEGPEGSSSD